MSRTKKQATGNTNPVKATVTYKPNAGEFEIYFKDTKKKVTELKEIKLIVLDADRFSITGFSTAYDSNLVSNLVHNSKKEKFTVGTFVNGKYKKVSDGFYQDIKDDLSGGKYTKNVIGLLEYEGEFVLADLQLTGTSKNTFMEWFQKHQPDGLVTITTSDDLYNYDNKKKETTVVPKEKQKKPRTTWFHLLLFDMEVIDEETSELADKEDEALQKYFESVGGKPASSNDNNDSEDSDEDEEESQDEEEDNGLPF